MSFECFVVLAVFILYVIVFKHKRGYERKVSEFDRELKRLKNELKTHLEAAGQTQPPEKMAEEIKPEEEIQENILPSVAATDELPESPQIQPYDQSAFMGIPPIPPEEQAAPDYGLGAYSISKEDDTREGRAGDDAKEHESPHKSPEVGGGWASRWKEFKANVDWETFTGVKLFAGLGGLALFIESALFPGPGCRSAAFGCSRPGGMGIEAGPGSGPLLFFIDLVGLFILRFSGHSFPGIQAAREMAASLDGVGAV